MVRFGRQVLAVTMALVVLLVSVACVGGTCLLAAGFAEPDAMAAGHACCGPSRSDDSAPADDKGRCDGALKGTDAAGTRTAPHQLSLHWLGDFAPADLVAAALQPASAHPLLTDAAFDPSHPPTLLALGCALNT